MFVLIFLTSDQQRRWRYLIRNELKDRLHHPEGKVSVRMYLSNDFKQKFSRKWAFCLHLITLVSFQTCMTFFHLWNKHKNNIFENIWPVKFCRTVIYSVVFENQLKAPYVIFSSHEQTQISILIDNLANSQHCKNKYFCLVPSTNI